MLRRPAGIDLLSCEPLALATGSDEPDASAFGSGSFSPADCLKCCNDADSLSSSCRVGGVPILASLWLGQVGWLRVSLAFVCSLTIGLAPALQAQASDGQAIENLQPLLQQHCLDCHSGGQPDGGVNLESFKQPIDYLKGRRLWERAIQKVQLSEMPPPDSSRMTDEQRQQFQQWVKSALNEFECGVADNPGRVTLRRLNAAEYRHTVQELLQVNYQPAKDFPGDDVGYGFDNIGDVLTLPPLLMEKYLVAAEEISRQVFATPPSDQTFVAQYAGGQLSGDGHGQSDRVLASAGTAWWTEQLPWGGAYQLKLRLSGDQAGDEPVQAVVLLENKQVKKLTITVDRSQPQEYVVSLRLKPGKATLGIRFLNDFYQPSPDGKGHLDRNMVIHHVELQATRPATEKLDESKLSALHRQMLSIQEKKQESHLVFKQMLHMLASRAYRRPVTQDELDGLVKLATDILEEDGKIEVAFQVALQALLISPKFLYLVEPPQGDASDNAYPRLDDFELASRLSYFLWSSMPDNRLFALAWEGKLRQPDILQQQIDRMIQDPRANRLVENFAGQWLTLRKLRNFQPNADQFPQWNEQIRGLVERETLTFFAGVMRKNLSVVDLLDGQFSYMNQPLAEYYGIAGVQGDHFREVSLAGTGRRGLLTQASVLSVTSNPTRTSPVKRGKWILDNLLAQAPPPAPPGVPELEKVELKGTLRQRLEQHRRDPACANCHKLMDPLGFSLENYDAIGRYRSTEAGQPIDSSGELPDGSIVRDAEQLRQILSTQYRDDFVRCLTEKLLTYALGRGLEYYDKCAVDKIVEKLEQDQYRFGSLITQIVLSDPFQKKGQR